jgi:hypothetical protein
MNFLQHEIEAGPDDVVEVSLSGQANVRLLDASNFSSYPRGPRASLLRRPGQGLPGAPSAAARGALVRRDRPRGVPR